MIEDKEILELTKNNPTPFFVISERVLDDNLGFLRKSFSGIKDIKIYYSLKTNYESKVLLFLRNAGVFAEVCGELDMLAADRGGFSKKEIVFDGSLKTRDEILKALDWDIHLFNVESEDEIDLINELAGQRGKTAKIGLRVNTDFFSSHPLSYLFKYFQKSFGFLEKDLFSIGSAIRKKHNIELCGLMVHNNNPCKTEKDFVRALRIMFKIAGRFKKEGVFIKEINIGGGFPNMGQSVKMGRIAESICQAYCKLAKNDDSYPSLVIEPGRALIDNATILVGRIVRVGNKSAICDISINDLGYKFPYFDKKFHFIKAKDNCSHKVSVEMSISGPTLNPYDRLFSRLKMSKPCVGDLLVIPNAGAYTISRSTQFIRARAAVFFVNKDRRKILIRRKETPEDVLLTQIWDKKE